MQSSNTPALAGRVVGACADATVVDEVRQQSIQNREQHHEVVDLLKQTLHRLAKVEDRLDGRGKEMLTTEDVAELCDCSTYTVRRWISEGRLQGHRLTGGGPKGRWLIPRSAVDALVGR